MTKITIVGAGSVGFGGGSLLDVFAYADQLGECTVALHDVSAASLDLMMRLAARLRAATNAPLHFEATTDLAQALRGADFVIVAVARDRLPTWQRDWEIPRRHGIKHVLGENGGPGGLGHTLRSVWLVMEVAWAIERVAPEALVLNFTNPLSRVCMALNRATRLRVVGLCHGIGNAYLTAGRVFDLMPEGLEPPAAREQLERRFAIKAAGLNHHTFIYEMRDQATGEDVLPEFGRRLAAMPPDFEPLSRRLHRAFGLFPAIGDGHTGEYISFAWETSAMTGYDFAGRAEKGRALRATFEALASGATPLDPYIGRMSGERALPIICGILNNTSQHELAVNLPNAGYLAGLPEWAIVEVPGTVDAQGVAGERVPPLPPAIVALLAQQVAIQDRAVEAALHGDREAALQALLLDPVVSSYEAATGILNELLEAHAPYLPQFARVSAAG